MIEKTSQLLGNEVQCMKHPGQLLVAFDAKSMQFGCQQCIFHGVFENPEFITLKARDIHDRFKDNYEEYLTV